jgi:hypothetical protein
MTKLRIGLPILQNSICPQFYISPLFPNPMSPKTRNRKIIMQRKVNAGLDFMKGYYYEYKTWIP